MNVYAGSCVCASYPLRVWNLCTYQLEDNAHVNVCACVLCARAYSLFVSGVCFCVWVDVVWVSVRACVCVCVCVCVLRCLRATSVRV